MEESCAATVRLVYSASEDGDGHAVESLTVFREKVLAGCTDGALLVLAEKNEEGVGELGASSGEDEEEDDDEDGEEDGARGGGGGGGGVRNRSSGSLNAANASNRRNSSDMMDLIETHASFAKKPVLQLTAIAAHSRTENPASTSASYMLLSLTDGVALHTLPALSPHSSLARTRGANAYRWRADDRRLCVSCRKRLLVYRWDGVALVEVFDVALQETPKTLEWAGVDTVCVAFKKEYSIVCLRTGETRAVCPTSRNGEPSITALPCNELLLLKDSIGIFVANDGGEPTRDHGVSWSSAPDDVVLAWPHALAIMPRMVELKAVHRRAQQTGSIFFNQTLPLQGCIAVSERQRSGAMAWANTLFASSASGTQIHRITLLSQGELVHGLIDAGEIEEAVEIASLTPYDANDAVGEDDSEVRAMKVSLHSQLAERLMSSADYEDAISHMNLANASPRDVVSRFACMMPDVVIEKLRRVCPAIQIERRECEPTENESHRAMLALLPYSLAQSKDPRCEDGELMDTVTFMILVHIKDPRLKSFVRGGETRIDRQLVVEVLTSSSAAGYDRIHFLYYRHFFSLMVGVVLSWTHTRTHTYIYIYIGTVYSYYSSCLLLLCLKSKFVHITNSCRFVRVCVCSPRAHALCTVEMPSSSAFTGRTRCTRMLSDECVFSSMTMPVVSPTKVNSVSMR